MNRFFLLTFLFPFLFAVNARSQHCSYSKTAKAQALPQPTMVAEAAAQDENIEQRVDPGTGRTTYVRRSVCAATGKVSYTPVEYCSKSGRFVNISPREQHCVKSRAACTAKGAGATRVSLSEKTQCTTAQKAACSKACAGAKKSTSASAAKLVKNR
ncbi:MAG: hypothetical protein KDD06_26835 [Phaeodactylibacter sp.]|nr:hypothetical protein [Phaeodactylibacter sp.]MCB9287699.1 hypothetical protein [Lewinellaceae bacterium]